MKRLLAIAFVVSAAMASSAAAQTLTFGELAVTGTGCPAATATLSGGTLSPMIGIDGYTGEVGGADGAAFSRGACNASIPVEVPAGLSVAITGSGYRLDAALNSATVANISVEAFLAGDQGPPLTKTLTGPAYGPRIGAGAIGLDDRHWSACGDDVILRINSSLRLNAESPTRIPSRIDVTALHVRLAVRSC